MAKNTLEIAMDAVVGILKGRTEPLTQEQVWQKHREMTGCGGRAKKAILDAIAELIKQGRVTETEKGLFFLATKPKADKASKKEKPAKVKKGKSEATPNADLTKKTTKADNMALWADAVRIAGGKPVDVESHIEEKDGRKEEHSSYTLYCHTKESIAVFAEAGVPKGGWRKLDYATCSTYHQEIAGVMMDKED